MKNQTKRNTLYKKTDNVQPSLNIIHTTKSFMKVKEQSNHVEMTIVNPRSQNSTPLYCAFHSNAIPHRSFESKAFLLAHLMPAIFDLITSSSRTSSVVPWVLLAFFGMNLCLLTFLFLAECYVLLNACVSRRKYSNKLISVTFVIQIVYVCVYLYNLMHYTHVYKIRW